MWHDVPLASIACRDWLAGNDAITIASSVRIDSLLIGGSGDDELRSGAGSSVLLGGMGNDLLFGGNGRNILIGGGGSAQLHGQGDSDILIGGSTAHDRHSRALLQILAEWASSDSYSVRVAKISGGIGVPALNDNTVFDDFVQDDLFGGSLDWLFVFPKDRVHHA